MKRLPLALVAAVALAACDDSPTSSHTGEDSPAAAPSLALQNPAGSWEVSEDLFKIMEGADDRSSRRVTSPMKALSPTTLTVTLAAGETVPETKDVDLPAEAPQGDVLFLMDVSSSMGPVLSSVASGAASIMASVSGAVTDANFAVASLQDYPGYYSNTCGYPRSGSSALYGGAQDEPFTLNQPITAQTNDVASALSGLRAVGGADLPESYFGAFWEAANNPAVGWRPDATKIVVSFGDAIPHDCDQAFAYHGFSSGTGIDPGPDRIAGTADDVTRSVAQQALQDRGINLVHLHNDIVHPHYSSDWFSYWEDFTAEIGGEAILFDPADAAALVADRILNEVQTVGSLTIAACPGDEAYADWLHSVDPVERTNLTLPSDDNLFDIQVGPPAGTPEGVYTFGLCAVGDGGVFGRQEVEITVDNNDPPVADAGSDQSVECMDCETGSTEVVLDGSASYDVDGTISAYAWRVDGNLVATGATPTVDLTLGTYTLVLTVTDDDGESDTDEVTVTVEDTTAPEITFDLDVETLWSPNHEMVTVATGISVYDACDAGTALAAADITVTSNEDINGTGDGDTDADWAVIDNGDGTFDVQVRAERKGNGDGRIYTITVTSQDASGNESTATGEVEVPHSQGKGKK